MASRSSRRRDDDDDDDYPPRRRRFEDDDDDEDRPRDRRGRSQSNAGLWWALGGTLGAFLLVGGIVIAIFQARRNAGIPVRNAPEIANAIAPEPPFVPEVNLPAIPAGTVRTTLPARAVSSLYFHTVGGADGHAIHQGLGTAGYRLTVTPLNGPGRGTNGSTEVATGSVNEIIASKDGKWLSLLVSKPGFGNEVRLYDVTTGLIVRGFLPYPRQPGQFDGPNTISVGFLPDNRLVTINDRGGYDVWSNPGGEKLHGFEGALPSTGRLALNGFTKAPTNFAYSTSRPEIVLFNGKGFTLHDADRAFGVRDLETIVVGSAVLTFYACALTEDGSKLALLYTNSSDPAGGRNRCAVWDTATGKKINDVEAKGLSSIPGMGWWGDRYLLTWEGGMSRCRIVDPVTGVKLGEIRGDGTCKFSQYTSGGKLWCLVSEPLAQEMTIVGVDPPANIPPNARGVMTTRGLRFE